MAYKTFGEAFKAHRLALGMTLRQFCAANGLDPANISKLERNILPPPKEEKILAYALALKRKSRRRRRATVELPQPAGWRANKVSQRRLATPARVARRLSDVHVVVNGAATIANLRLIHFLGCEDWCHVLLVGAFRQAIDAVHGAVVRLRSGDRAVRGVRPRP